MTTVCKEVAQIAQVIEFTKTLASNNQLIRQRALRKFKKWLTSQVKLRADFSETAFMRLWKGLIHCVWMTDKPLIQEETIDLVCSCVHVFSDLDDCLSFIRCYYESIAQIWMGLDLHRLDKFMMFVRRFLRATFVMLKNSNWDVETIRQFSVDFLQSLDRSPPGLLLHITDIYLEELAKVGGETISSEIVISFLDPWFIYVSSNEDSRLIKAIRDNLFLYLIKQSDLGIKHTIKFEVWKSMGFPGGDLSVMDGEDSSNEEGGEIFDELEENGKFDQETALDPRAGHVDTVLPILKFDPLKIINGLEHCLTVSNTSSKARKIIKNLISSFKLFAQGHYPLGFHKVDIPEEDDHAEEVEKAAENLMNFDSKNYASSLTNKKRYYDYCNLEKESFKYKKRKSDWYVTEIDENDSPCEGSSNDTTVITRNNVWKVTPFDSDNSPGGSHRNSADTNVTAENTNLDSHHKKISHKNAKTSRGNDKTSHANTKSTSHGKKSSQITEKTSSKKRKSRKNRKRSTGHARIIGETEISIKAENHHETKRRWSFHTSSENKRVCFVLSNNSFHGTEDYMNSVMNSPSLPYDAAKKPFQSVLKHAHLTSPINPFFKFSNKKNNI